MGDELITRAVVSNIWRGDLSNNWKEARGVPPPHDVDSYNFSSYMYADALFTGRPKHNSWRLDRWFSAITGTAAIYLFYLVALRLLGFEVALLSLAVLAVAPILVQDSHYGRPESFVTLLCAVVYVFALQRPNYHTRITFIAASSFYVGLLIACKVSMIPLILIPLLGLGFSGSLRFSSVSISVASAILGIFAGVPGAFFHPILFWSGVDALRHQYANPFPPHSSIDSANSFRLLTTYFWQTLGPVFCVFCIAGIMALVKRHKYFDLAIIAGPLLCYVVFFGMQGSFFERNLSHVVPLAAILTSVGLLAICKAVPRRGRLFAVFALVLLLLSWPAQISAKLVFVAMANTWDERIGNYERLLLKTQGLPVTLTSSLLNRYDVQYMEESAFGSSNDILVRILDFHDDFTRSLLPKLETSLAGHEVGCFPSLFPDFAVNTILVYHTPTVRYIRLSPAQLQRQGFTFASWTRVGQPLTPLSLYQQSWIEKGVYPNVGVPVARDTFFGSYTAAGDSNRGTIRMGPLDVRGLSQVAIPIVTGPVTAGLSLSVIDHSTGLFVGRMNPPPVLPKWVAWQVNLAGLSSGQIDIVAKDEGAGWGQWLGVGFPLTLDSADSSR